MKRALTLMVLAALILPASLAMAEEEAAFAPTDSKILVACFSATGNTWPLAQAAAEYLNADLFRIQPETPYTPEDLDYNNDECRANQEMSDETCRPTLAETVPNMEQYDVVILAFPIWWGQAPRIVETFVEAHDFSGKTVLPFCTSGGSGFGSTGEKLAALTGEDVIWLEGARFSADTGAEELAEWFREMGIAPYQK